MCVCVCVCSAITFAKSHAEVFPYRISIAVFPAQKCGRWPVNTPPWCDLQIATQCLHITNRKKIPLSVSQQSIPVVVSEALQAKKELSVTQHSEFVVSFTDHSLPVVSFTAFIVILHSVL